MSRATNDAFNPRVIGISPLGNNSVEATAEGHTPIEDTSVREVPLVYDPSLGIWCDKLSKINQEDRDTSLEVAKLTNEDQSFLARAGYQQS